MTTAHPTGIDGVTVTIDGAVLPGVVYELRARVGMCADKLQHELLVRAVEYEDTEFGERPVLTRMGRFIDLLDQIGWQTRQSVAVTGDPGFLLDVFGDIAEDAARCVDDIARDPAHWTDSEWAARKYAQALEGARQVLAQLEPVGIA